jgi:photosystem II stability/assembly factor-like uncharacterized protein
MRLRAFTPVLLLAACSGRGAVPTPSQAQELFTRLQPAPTEHIQDEGAEQRHKRERKRWIEEMHLAPPDVDWRAIERANGQAEMERRGTLASALGPSSWSEVGSRNLAGRMHCARLGPGGPGERKLYAGSALGGLWRGDPGGTNWEPLGDSLFGGVHELLVRTGDLPGAPDIVLTANDGGAVHVTRDLGATWQVPAGLPSFSSIRGVEQAGDASQTWYILGRHGSNMSLYASIDGGLTFAQRWTHNVGWNGSLWVPRSGAASATDVYLLHRGELWRSIDGGHNFSLSCAIASSATGGVLTGSEAGAPHLFAALQISGQWKLYRSTDGGGSFAFRKDIGDFWESLCASTSNPNLVIHAGVEAWRSTDGGAAFTKINGWGDYYGDPAHKLHADLPGLFCWPDPDAPTTSEVWYFCTDGGLYESTDSASSVQNISLSGLGVSQYYSTLSSSANPDRIAAGAQDQGYQRGVLQPSSGPGPSTDFVQLISGDYGHLTSGDGSHGLVYSTYPGFILVHDGEVNPALHYVDFPSGSSQRWLPPVVADPTDNQSFYFLGRYLYRYTRSSGSTWSWTQHSSQSFTDSGGNYLSALAIAPSNTQRHYAVNDRGRLYRSTNGGATWQVSVQGGPDSHYFYGHALAVHPGDELQAFVGGSGYSSGGVWRTTNGGQTWSEASSGLPSTLVYDLAFAGDGSGELYAATEAGAYRWTSASGSWENVMGAEAPITLYWSVEAVPSREVMRFGTYGRGIWDYDYAPCDGPTTYCGTSPNSVGSGATISHAGSSSLTINDLVLVSDGLLPGKPGLFYYGSSQTAVLLGEGVRCVDGALTRLGVIVADAFGIVSVPLDLDSPPFSSGPGAVGVGDVRNFQYWYRDPAGGAAGFNLSDALEVTFCP